MREGTNQRIIQVQHLDELLQALSTVPQKMQDYVSDMYVSPLKVTSTVMVEPEISTEEVEVVKSDVRRDDRQVWIVNDEATDGQDVFEKRAYDQISEERIDLSPLRASLVDLSEDGEISEQEGTRYGEAYHTSSTKGVKRKKSLKECFRSASDSDGDDSSLLEAEESRPIVADDYDQSMLNRCYAWTQDSIDLDLDLSRSFEYPAKYLEAATKKVKSSLKLTKLYWEERVGSLFEFSSPLDGEEATKTAERVE